MNEEENKMSDSMVNELQNELDGLRKSYKTALDRIEKLENEKPTPAGSVELQALAVTIRSAMHKGHPDAAKHVDALLNKLGAV